jgi:putative membrane protein
MKIISLALVLTLLAPFARAADPTVSPADKMFVMKAAQGGMTEVALGKLASEKAGSADVKAFGAMMVTDHTAANDELKAIATKKGLKVPKELNKKHAKVADELSKLSGAVFDKAYVPAMVKGHTETIALFENEAKTGQDADLKAFAEKTLPTIKMHLEKIEAIQKSMK